jgi:hypothetical protein
VGVDGGVTTAGRGRAKCHKAALGSETLQDDGISLKPILGGELPEGALWHSAQNSTVTNIFKKDNVGICTTGIYLFSVLE